MMRVLSILALVLLMPVLAAAAPKSDWDMERMRPNLHDKPSLQRGAALYMNFCWGCHSLAFQRYEATADFLGVPHTVFWDNLVFSREPIGSLMANAMPIQARNWFGTSPPDLTMVTRVRGETWVYNFLKTFYEDETRPFGANNKVFPNVGMPHALVELQGMPREVCVQVPTGGSRRAAGRDPLSPEMAVTGEECGFIEVPENARGMMNAEEFDQAIYDLTNFLYYVGDPVRLDRYRLGIYVILFLVILLVLAELLAREYRKEVH
jgi:cytochrome c1